MFHHNDPRYRGWKKSTRSDGGQSCVEVGDPIDGSDAVGVADSKAGPTAPVLSFTGTAWRSFVGSVKGGRLA